MSKTFHDKIEETESLAKELRHLLRRDSRLLKEEGVFRQTEELVGWVESYFDGLHEGAATDKISADDNAWHAGVSDRLKMEGMELHSLDDRSDSSSDKKQPKIHPKTGDFIDSAQQVSAIVSDAKSQSKHQSLKHEAIPYLSSRPSQKRSSGT